jgi:hypothetical protein
MTLGIKGKLLDSRMTLKNIARCEKSFKVEPVKTGDTQETKDKYTEWNFSRSLNTSFASYELPN